MEKSFYRMDNIGKAKYTVNFHDGIQTHKDGSPFFGMRIFKNKKKMAGYIKELQEAGYVDRIPVYWSETLKKNVTIPE